MQKVRGFIFLLLLLMVSLDASETKSTRKTVCLNMIVKNETKVIRRCLASVKPIIDYWVIVDTGSSDGTQKMIKEFMKGIPGELHERPWENFEHNRNEALDLAKDKADYLLFIDADEELIYDPTFTLPLLDKEYYFIVTEYGGTKYCRNQLINAKLPWRWKGVVHEALYCPIATNCSTLASVHNFVRAEGCRSQDPKKYEKDVAVLKKALEKEPLNARYMFYLAQSHRDAGQLEEAIKAYEKRIAMGGWDQEIYWSMYQIAALQEKLEMDPKIFIESYKNAFAYRPSRIEALYHLIEHHRVFHEDPEAYKYWKIARNIPRTTDLLFVEDWMYSYGLAFEASICAYWLGEYSEALALSKSLLENPNLPKNIERAVKHNLTWIYKQIEGQPPYALTLR